MSKGTTYILEMYPYDPGINMFSFTITYVLNDAETVSNLSSGYHWFEFTPKYTGYYKFYPSKSTSWSEGSIFNKLNGLSDDDFPIAEFDTDPIEYKLTASTTYYFYIVNTSALTLYLNMLGVVEIYDTTTSTWKRAIPYVYTGSAWKQTMGYIYKNSTDKW
jgi:hypothetical protein